MTPAEWREVKELLAEALELPADERPAFLERRCGGDAALRRELESLLEAGAADGLLDRDPKPPPPRPALAAGEVVGPYTIEGKLAEGGMGEVYTAFDARLDRRVAVKVLPSRQGTDPGALARFERETKALAALSHPNILAIFDVGRHRGVAFAVMELLTGATLRQRLARGRLPVDEAVDWAIQVARGLAAAHERGIVHRDLKPENLVRTASGLVKILDFGIAAFAAPADAPATAAEGRATSALTARGLVIGTPGYMSPEQATGERCDSRSDLFSLGAVLYEALTGRTAFQGQSSGERLYALLEADPEPLRSHCREAGRELARAVHRCLEKDRTRRFQSAGDLAYHLESLLEPAREPAEIPPSPARRRPWALGAGIAAAAAAAGLAAFVALRPAATPPPKIEFFSHSSRDGSPTATTDGRLVAFASERDGRSRIWLKQAETGDERALTEGSDSYPRFSPSGQALLFTRQEPGGPALYRVGTLSGETQRIVATASLGDWSPDGSRVAFVREESGEPRNNWYLGVVAVDGSGERLAPVEHFPLSHLRWAPDGASVLAVRQRSAVGVPDDLLRFDLASGGREVLPAPSPGGRISLPAWTRDGRALLFAQTESVTGYLASSRVVLFAPRSGRSRTLFWLPGVIDVLDPLGEDRLVFDAIDAPQSLGESGPGGMGAGAAGVPERWLTRGTSVDRQPAWSPDGESLVFSSNRSGNVDLWRLSTRTGALKRLTEHPADDWDPAFSPDGRRLVWSSNRTGGFEIFVADADGHNPRQVTHDALAAENPSVTADGAWIVYSSGQPGRDGIRRVRLDGREDRLVTTRARGHPEVSPDGRYVAFHTHLINGTAEVRVARVADGEVLPFVARVEAAGHRVNPRVTLGRPRWLPDGRGLAFVDLSPAGEVEIEAQGFDPESGTAGPRSTLLAAPPDLVPESFGIAADGRLAVSFIRRTSSLMTASGLRFLDLRP